MLETCKHTNKTILVVHKKLTMMYRRRQKSVKNKVQKKLKSEANVFFQHNNVHVIKGTDMTKLVSYSIVCF